jgi:hypothetical protein
VRGQQIESMKNKAGTHILAIRDSMKGQQTVKKKRMNEGHHLHAGKQRQSERSADNEQGSTYKLVNRDRVRERSEDNE